MEETLLEKRFADLDEDYASFKKAKVSVIQAPYDGTLTYLKGARRGPEAIIEASRNMELFDDELHAETFRIGIHTNPPIEIEPADPPEKIIDKVKETAKNILDAGKFPVLLGGEHSVTIGAVKACKEAFGDLSVLYFDAHYDLRDEYRGSKYNHACVARRIHQICPITEIAVRSLSKGEKDFLNTSPAGLNIVSAYDILENPDWKRQATNSLSENVYITVDLDVLDPSLMPSVGTPEPGGLGWYEPLDFLKMVTRNKKIVGFDVVELSPKEGFVAPDFLAAKLVYKLLGYAFFNKK